MILHPPWDKRASVYDRASTLSVVSLVLVAVGIALFIGGIMLGWILGIGGMAMTALMPRCVRCGKSPLVQRLLSRDSFAYRFWFATRLWPEHICSECGTNLQIPPGHRTHE